MSTVLDQIKGGLVVSCQAYPGEPLLDPRTMCQMAKAAVLGGAVGIRGKGLDDLGLIRTAVAVPLIGLVKVGEQGVYITPTLEDCLHVAATGADIVALDGTRRPRPDGLTLAQTITQLKQAHPGCLVMADCGSLADALAAEQAGADILGTTLAGYTGERPRSEGPDWELVDDVVARAERPVLVEGRIHTPSQAAEAMERGAHAVVVGTAITHLTTITRWFSQAVAEAQLT